MTYKELLEKLKILPEEQLNLDVTVVAINAYKQLDEFYKAGPFLILQDSDVLDKDHPIITFNV